VLLLKLFIIYFHQTPDDEIDGHYLPPNVDACRAQLEIDNIHSAVTNHVEVREFGNPLSENEFSELTHIVNPCQVELSTLVDCYLLARQTIVNLFNNV
jgi:hypothetical protein